MSSLKERLRPLIAAKRSEVRDLIAGPQLSDYGDRITELENTAREQAALTAQLRDAISALERATSALAERDELESSKRVALGEELNKDVTKLEADLVNVVSTLLKKHRGQA